MEKVEWELGFKELKRNSEALTIRGRIFVCIFQQMVVCIKGTFFEI